MQKRYFYVHLRTIPHREPLQHKECVSWCGPDLDHYKCPVGRNCINFDGLDNIQTLFYASLEEI